MEDGEEQREALRNQKEQEEKTEKKDSDPEKSVTTVEEKDSDNEYEDVCFICRRPESKAGKMFRLPNHICVCDDCMHKTMDTVSQFDYQGMLNNTGNPDQNKEGRGRFPNISFVNIADLQGDGGIPNRQKLKKKKSKSQSKKLLKKKLKKKLQ